MKRLQSKIAIITGGARGMGAATARVFADEGATVVIADMLETEGNALAAMIGGSSIFRSLNVADESQWETLVNEVVKRFGRVDALVNNAGVLSFGDIESSTAQEFDRVFSVNVKGPLLGIKYIGKAMKATGTGSIVNISSVDGLRGVNGVGVYSSSKWAIRGLTKAAALEYGHHGIRVNSVHPGGVDTLMGNPAGQTGADRNSGYERVPLQRIGECNEVAAASLFLCSDEASYITGAELAVDGGWAAGYYHSSLPGAPASLAIK